MPEVFLKRKKPGFIPVSGTNFNHLAVLDVDVIAFFIIFFELTLFQNIFYHFHKENIVYLE